MRSVIVLVYVVMAVWLLLASGIRIALQLSHGQDLDFLPFVSGGIGLLGLVLLLPGYEEWRASRRNRDEDRA